MNLHIDFETFSECDLTTHGAYNYAKHPSTDIICIAYQIDDNEIKHWNPALPLPLDLFDAIQTYPIHAWNIQFEKLIWKNVLIPKYDFPDANNFICTMALAMSFGIPGSLKKAGLFLEIESDNLKLKSGTRLINKLSIPRKITKTNTSLRWTPISAPQDFQDFYDYNKHDVIAEKSIAKILPRSELFNIEKRIFKVSNDINERGILIDLPVAKMMKSKLNHYNKLLNQKIVDITGGEVQSILQRDKTLNYLKTQRICLPDLTADTVESTLKKELPPKVKELLEIRQALAQSSVKKYMAMVDYANPSTHRVYGTLQYFGSHTGRYAGRGIQVQNFPRESFENDEEAEIALQNILDLSYIELESKYEMTFPSLAKKLLRQTIIAPQNKELLIADFSSIENRCAAWISGDSDALNMFRENRDQYIEMAMSIFNCKYEEVTKEQRTISKGVVLGAQFGLGAKGLVRALSGWDLIISEETAKVYIDRYRYKYKKIVEYWYSLENSCIDAVKSGKLISCGKINIKVQSDFLFLKLPIGRTISYFKPKLENSVTPWGADKLTITYKSPFGRKTLLAGSIFENIVQGIARDFMCEGMLMLEENDYKVTMSVHDEIVVEDNKENFMHFMKIMTTPPKWALDFPLQAEGFYSKRYRK